MNKDGHDNLAKTTKLMVAEDFCIELYIVLC